MRCSFWCKMTIGSMYIRGFTEVWVKGGSTVLIFILPSDYRRQLLVLRDTLHVADRVACQVYPLLLLIYE